jgi:hypothetical protein
MLWHSHLAHLGLKALEILRTITDAPKMTGKCDCESCIKCILAHKPFAPTTSRATEPVQLIPCNIYGPMDTAIRGGRNMLLFIDNATSSSNNSSFRLKHPGVPDGSDGSDGNSYPLPDNYMLPVAKATGRIPNLPPLHSAGYTHHQNNMFVTLFAGAAVIL